MKPGKRGKPGTFAKAPPGYRLHFHGTRRVWIIKTPPTPGHPRGVKYEAAERAKALDMAWWHFNEKAKERDDD